MSPEKIIKSATVNRPTSHSNVTKRQIVEAREEAQRIVAAAEAEAAVLRDSAAAEARERRETAYREGYEAALLEWNELLFEARERREAAINGIQRDLLRLSVKIAEKIVGRELKRDPKTVVALVATALRNVRRSELITIRVNPSDTAALEDHRTELDPAGRARFLEIVSDPRVTGGGCIIESDSGAVDAQLDTQLRVLGRALLMRASGEER